MTNDQIPASPMWDSGICRYASASRGFQAVKSNELLFCSLKSFKGRQPLKLKIITKPIKKETLSNFLGIPAISLFSYLPPTKDLCQCAEQAQLLETEVSGIKIMIITADVFFK